MARYIDADKLLDKRQEIEVDGLLFKHSWYTMYDNLIKAINDAPTADVVEVVRCKNCKHRHSSEFCECRDENAYCSDGERRTDNDL